MTVWSFEIYERVVASVRRSDHDSRCSKINPYFHDTPILKSAASPAKSALYILQSAFVGWLSRPASEAVSFISLPFALTAFGVP